MALAGCGGAGPGAPTAPAPSGAERPATEATAAPAAPRYGVIGDSYSNGEGLSPEQAWPELLARRLGLRLVVNPAVSGWTTREALDRELPQFAAAEPELATLMIGVNDLVQGATPAEFRGRLRELLSRMIAIVGGPRRVVVVTFPDFSVKPVGARFGDPRVVARAVERFDAIIRAEARRQGAPLADVLAVSRRPTDPSPDGLHPSAAELEAWTDVIAPVARDAWRDLR